MPYFRFRPPNFIHRRQPARSTGVCFGPWSSFRRAERKAFLIATLMALSSIGGCQRNESAPPSSAATASPGVPVSFIEARQMDVQILRRSVGTVQPIDMVNLTSEVEGLIEAISFEETTRVEAGQVLVRLNARQAEAELEAARARRDRIALQFESLEQLHQRGAASTKEFRDIRSELIEAEALLRLAEIRLEKHTIRAPFAGQVGLRLQSLGAWVRAGDPLTTLIATDPIEVRFQLPEQILAQVALQQPVELSTPAYPERKFIGRLATIDSVVDPQTRSISLLAQLPNPDGLLKPGMFTDVSLVIAVRKRAVIVPETALSTRGRETTLFVIEDGRAFRKTVQIGQRRAGWVEILEGLVPGQQVITSDPERLRDQMAVDPRPDTTLPALDMDRVTVTAGG